MRVEEKSGVSSTEPLTISIFVGALALLMGIVVVGVVVSFMLAGESKPVANVLLL
jgi:hypothetical protein